MNWGEKQHIQLIGRKSRGKETTREKQDMDG
jgi:hypothetical protein